MVLLTPLVYFEGADVVFSLGMAGWSRCGCGSLAGSVTIIYLWTGYISNIQVYSTNLQGYIIQILQQQGAINFIPFWPRLAEQRTLQGNHAPA